MYWNMVNKASHEFSEKFGFAPSKIYMNFNFYCELEREMVGDQWWFLIKENSVRGMKIVIDDGISSFVIAGTKL